MGKRGTAPFFFLLLFRFGRVGSMARIGDGDCAVDLSRPCGHTEVMPKTAAGVWLALLVVAAEAQGLWEGQLGTRLRYEPGVESGLLVTGLTILPVGRRTRLRLAGARGVLGSQGFAVYGLDAELRPVQSLDLRFRAGAAHEQWHDWQAGENRVFGFVTGSPWLCLELGVGLVWRATIFDPARFSSPCYWRSPVSEWNLAYLADWAFLCRPGFELSIRLANLGLLTVHNPQQLPLGLLGRFSVGADWHVSAGCAAAVNGLSGLLVSASEIAAELGVSRDF